MFLFNKYIVFSLWIDAGQDTAYVVVLSSIALLVFGFVWPCYKAGTRGEISSILSSSSSNGLVDQQQIKLGAKLYRFWAYW